MSQNLDINRLTDATFGRLQDDAAGAALRALLPAGAAGIIPEHLLSRDHLPPRPFLAIARGSVAAIGRLRRVPFVLYLYDNPARGIYALEQLATAVEDAFDVEVTPWQIDGVALGGVVVGDRAQVRPDPLLGLSVLPVRVVITAL